ncbi:hypothetical protein [Pantoea vagans]|uniref:hypothetical protein n=1 Tax=Pantoea vagans TaxID=470934 RepID=UPI00366AB060
MDTALLSALDSDGKTKFESAVNALQGDVSAAAARLSVDPRLRLEYSKRIKEMAEDLRAKASSGIISWDKAAMEAQETRNLIMDMVRTRSTPLGRAMAERMKTSGVTLNELVAKKLPLCSGQRLIFTAYLKRKKIRFMPRL